METTAEAVTSVTVGDHVEVRVGALVYTTSDDHEPIAITVDGFERNALGHIRILCDGKPYSPWRCFVSESAYWRHMLANLEHQAGMGGEEMALRGLISKLETTLSTLKFLHGCARLERQAREFLWKEGNR